MSKILLPSEEKQQEIINFYLIPNTESHTWKTFKITRATLNKILATHAIKKHSQETINALRKQTCLAVYGVESVMQVKSVQEKGNETLIQKHGSIENAYKVRQEKLDRTKLERYGNTKYNNRNKYKETCLDRFGCENPFQNEAVKQKCNTVDIVNRAEASRHKTFVEKYGVECVGQLEQSHQNYSYFYDNTYFDSSWELALWIYANDHNEDIVRLPCTIEFEYNSTIRTYRPDFKYNGQLVEVKGDQFIYEGKLINPYRDNTGLDSLKTELIKKYDIQLWSSREIKPILIYITKNYGKDYLKQFKV